MPRRCACTVVAPVPCFCCHSHAPSKGSGRCCSARQRALTSSAALGPMSEHARSPGARSRPVPGMPRFRPRRRPSSADADPPLRIHRRWPPLTTMSSSRPPLGSSWTPSPTSTSTSR
jgi:hypothetical protein